MNKIAAGFGTALAFCLYALPSHAQATRTFVSGVGADDNPCSRTAPCKTFAGAISKTFINGEINCLDPAGYGTVTITKSITIDCTGTLASILAGGTTGIIVSIPTNANDPTRSVRVRGLSINGAGASGLIGTRTGIDGIRVTAGTSLFVENTVISEFAEQGIQVQTNGTFNLSLDNVTIRNTNAAGVALSASGGQVIASFNKVRIDGTPLALAATGSVRASIRNVTLAHNATGIQTSGLDNVVNADKIMVSFASSGILANPTGAVRLSNSVITQNVTGITANNGSMISMSGNSVTGNTTDGAFTSTAPKQ